MFESHYTHRKTLDTLRSQINTLPPLSKLDCLKMYRNTEKLFQDMDRELVNCRRRQRLTANYLELEQSMLKSQATLEKRLTFAYLM